MYRFLIVCFLVGCAVETTDVDAGTDPEDVAVTSEALTLQGYELPIVCKNKIHWLGTYNPFVFDGSSVGSTNQVVWYNSNFGSSNQIQAGAFWSFGKAGLYMGADSPYCTLTKVKIDVYCHNDITNAYATTSTTYRDRQWYAPWDGFEKTLNRWEHCVPGLHIERVRVTATTMATTVLN